MKKWVHLISFCFLAIVTVGLGLSFWCRGDRVSGAHIVDIVGLMRLAFDVVLQVGEERSQGVSLGHQTTEHERAKR